MNVTLISLDQELYCVGVRILSSCLRQAGHRVQCLFLPPPPAAKARAKYRVQYSAPLLEQVRELCANEDLIGISLMSNQLIQAIDVTEHLKREGVSAPIVWGGVQPTIEPEACLRYADIVCQGEGEEALVELADHCAQGLPYHNIKNLWVNTADGVVRNPLRPLETDLDALPLPDYSCRDHFIGYQDRIEALTADRLFHFHGERFRARGGGVHYPLLTSRGCPHACTYCCNSAFQKLYPGQRTVRWRSADSVIGELQMIQTGVGPLAFVYIVDDNFTVQSHERLEAFCTQYKQEVGVPFSCQVSPLSINAEKLDTLLEAGCVKITMGVESDSEHVAGIYNRSHFQKALPSAIALLESYRPRMALPPTYQFIIDNPYETLDDTLGTLRLACSVARPWHNPIYSLMFFPGTPLHERAEKDGLLTDSMAQIYGRNWRVQSKWFFQLWIRLYRANAPPLLLRTLLFRPLARLLTGGFLPSPARLASFWRSTSGRLGERLRPRKGTSHEL
jgi:anaerobic magnesium-protoporphyrin IX monomethyl ester cyclase